MVLSRGELSILSPRIPTRRLFAWRRRIAVEVMGYFLIMKVLAGLKAQSVIMAIFIIAKPRVFVILTVNTIWNMGGLK